MRILWTATARRDANAIWDFIESDNPQAAELVDSRILDAVEALATHPRRGRVGRRSGTRELVVEGLPYIVVYSGGSGTDRDSPRAAWRSGLAGRRLAILRCAACGGTVCSGARVR